MFSFAKRLFVKLLPNKVSKGRAMLAPPATVKGMLTLDRHAFQKKITFPSLLLPVASIKQCKKILCKKLPDLNMKLLVDPDDEVKGHKFILLDPDKHLSSDDFKALEELGVEDKIHHHDIDIGYENYKLKDIMEAILPKDPEEVEGGSTPTGFSSIGHIVHLNLRNHQLPYKHVIGQVFLDKVGNARTVVRKIETIENQFRHLNMEVLAGEEDFITRVVEYNRIFEFDFSKVFWNPRLSTEHHRMTTMIPKDDVIFDVCAGVGPFAIPLARKGCRVYANDLNPDSVKWLKRNVKLNKAEMEVFNLDGRIFIQTELRNYVLNFTACKRVTLHVLINLPAIAVEFLDAFQGLLPELLESPQIIVHIYMFSSKDSKDEMKTRITHHLGAPPPSNLNIRFVRNVAPNKDQYCVTFVIPPEVLRNKDEPQSKRAKMT